MATLRNKRNFAIINREDHEELPRNSQTRDTNVSRIQEDYITEVTEQLESRLTKKIVPGVKQNGGSHFGRSFQTWRIFFLNPQFRVQSGSVLETSQTQIKKTRNYLRIITKMILILKQGSLWTSLNKISAQKMCTKAICTFDTGIQSFYNSTFPQFNHDSNRILWIVCLLPKQCLSLSHAIFIER